MAFTKRATLMAAFKRETGRSPQVPDQQSKEGDQAQLPSSEPRISAHGSHCVQGHYRGEASILLPGKMRH